MAENNIKNRSNSNDIGPVGKGTYIVKAGDCISSIAFEHGHFWKTIWNDADNKELRDIRKDPNVLFPGDRVTVPPLRIKEESGKTDIRHRFVRKGIPAKLRLRIVDYDQPRSDEAYILEVDGKFINGVTDSNGCIEVPIPANAKNARLTMTNDETTYDFDLGKVDPITEISGIQNRLSNLGYDCGPADNKLGSRTREAIRQFQIDVNLPQTGEPDQSTRLKLQQEHGS